MADWSAIETQLRAVAVEGERAWPQLQQLLHPELTRLARFQPIGRLRSDLDAPHEIVVRVFARLHANEYRTVKKLFSTEQPPSIGAWIRVIVRSAAIDFMREHPDYVRGNATREAAWISVQSLVSSDGSPPADSLVAKQREVEQYLMRSLSEAQHAIGEHGEDAVQALAIAWKVEPLQVRRLVKKGAQYLPVLRRVLAGHSYPEIAVALEITRREVELVVSYIEEFLRARGFASEPG